MHAFTTLRAEPSFFSWLRRRRTEEGLPESRQTFEVPAAQTSGLVNLVFSRQTGLFEWEHPLIDEPMVIRRCTKRRAIRPGFETISQQHAAHVQQRCYSILAESFSSTPWSSKWKKGSAGRLLVYTLSIMGDEYREVWRHVTMVPKFLDHKNSELKQRQWRRQREWQKSNRLRSAKQYFCTFLSRRYTTATWNL